VIFGLEVAGPETVSTCLAPSVSDLEDVTVAEREGFEPSKGLPPYGISSAAPSAN
jgi:hypothetical protein